MAVQGFGTFAHALTKASRDLNRLLPTHVSKSLYKTVDPRGLMNQSPTTRATTDTLSFLQNSPLFTRNQGLRPTSSTGPVLHSFGYRDAASSPVLPRFGGMKQQPEPTTPTQATTTSDAPDAGNPSAARGLEGTQQWSTELDRAASDSGVPKEVLQSIMGIETGGQNLPANNAGAIGVMQVVPEYWQTTANQFGGSLSDPYTNIRTAAEILKINYAKYGSWEKSAAAYFGGDGAFNPDGSYSTHADSYGTNITDYVTAFRNNMAALGYGRPSNAEAANGGQAASPSAQEALKLAMSVQGTPYVWGGSNTAGFDCSGLVAWAYGRQGKHFGRTAQEQYDNTQRIGTQDLQPGDLVFFQFPDDSVRPGQGGQINHVAIYMGNGQMIQATSDGGVVKISNMSDDWYQRHIVGFGRVL